MLSFIVPFRGRDTQIKGLIKSIREYYTNYEIIISCQADNEIFKHGQLRNLGYRVSKGDMVIFIDVDVRFLKFIDFEFYQSTLAHPFIGFTSSYEMSEEHTVFKHRSVNHCIGRLVCFTRKQFEDCGGYSNLCLGWGWEDDILNKRAQLKKIEGVIGHIHHSYQRGRSEDQNRNRILFSTDSQRDHSLDGFRQTRATLLSTKEELRIKWFDFCNIGVSEDFEYKNLL